MVLAGIVLYNPDLSRLKDNIEAIIPQVDKVVLIDNGSSNINQIDLFLSNYTSCKLVKNDVNNGIAAALNQILNYAKKYRYEWVLTLDQDSVCQEGLIENYEKYIHLNNVAVMTCNIVDRNFILKKDREWIGDFEYIDNCITSGSFVNVSACLAVGGFDDSMFIDRVDTDLCFTLRKHNYKIIKLNILGLLHEVGNSTRIKNLFGKEIVIFNHSPFRSYYIIRNGIYFVRKHKDLINVRKSYFSVYRRILVFLVFEDQKLDKLKASIRGLIDGHKMKIKTR
jgi:rhamnosyltransferase